MSDGPPRCATRHGEAPRRTSWTLGGCIASLDVLPEVRRLAIEGLWEDERLDLMRRLITLLESDPSDMVRAAAATSLGRYVYGRSAMTWTGLAGIACGRHWSASQSLEVARRALECWLLSVKSPYAADRRRYAHSDPLMRQSAPLPWGEAQIVSGLNRAGQLTVRGPVPAGRPCLGRCDSLRHARVGWLIQ